MKMITEPVAAALAFGLDKAQGDEMKKCVIFDFGGGTLDVTCLEINNKSITTKSINGESNLGGQDIDLALIKWCIETYNKENPEQKLPSPKDNPKMTTNLWKKCTEAKIEFSNIESS